MITLNRSIKTFPSGTLQADKSITPYQQVVLRELEKLCATYGVVLIYPEGLGQHMACTIECQLFVGTTLP